MRSSIALIASAIAVTAAKDSLVTRRHEGMNKRFVDAAGNYNVTFLHTNDIHAHLDEWRAGRGTDCTTGSECIAGYPRIKATINRLRNESRDAIVLDAGDEFQGTLFFSYYGGEKVSQAVNEIGYDLFTLGNHEFDKGIEHLGAFLNNITFPTVCANLVTNYTPVAEIVKPYHIFEQHNLAVIGVITPDTKGTSSGAGPGTDFLDPVETIQKHVDELTAQNITRIVALTHIGYDKDIELAQKTRGVDLIIGAHSHTPLGPESVLPEAVGPYPTIAKNLDGEEVFIVTSYRWGEVVGRMNVAWDAAGKIVSYDGEPVRLSNTTAEDATLAAEVAAWRAPFDELAKTVVGSSLTVLDQSNCQTSECTLGDYVTDAMYDYRASAGGLIDAAIINAGGIRATIEAGNVTQGQVLTSFPFLNAVTDLTFTGEELWNIFEGIASDTSNVTEHEVTSFVQVSKQIKFAWNEANPIGSRLIGFNINGEPLDFTKTYTIVALDFLATGGDYFWKPRTDYVALGTLDEIVVQYLSKGVANQTVEGRIIATTETKVDQTAIVGNSTAPTTGGSTSGASSLEIFATTIFFAIVGLVIGA